MMAAKPLLVSSSAPLKRLVTKYKSGVVFEAGNPADFAEKAQQLYSDHALSNELGENGRKATLEGNLNWETTQLELIRLYNSI